jgi:hypothetical protein
MSANRTIRTNGKKGSTAVLLSNLQVIKERMIFDTCSGKFHQVSETAAYVIRKLQDQEKMPDIIVAYSKHYKLPLTVAARDIELFMNDIKVK